MGSNSHCFAKAFDMAFRWEVEETKAVGSRARERPRLADPDRRNSDAEPDGRKRIPFDSAEFRFGVTQKKKKFCKGCRK